MGNFFKFENENEDFPFYNGIPKLELKDWIILVIGIALFIKIILGPIEFESHIFSILLCLVLIIPVIYVTRGHLGLFLKKPKRSDAKLIILCLVAYYLYTAVIVILLKSANLPTNANAVLSSNMDLMFWITVLIQLVGEEFFRILLFIMAMALVYHFTKNRKFCIFCGLIVTLTAFGLIHYGAYGSIIQILLIQGLGGIFEMYAYMKTKNVVVTYILHVLTDAIPFTLTIIMNMYNIPVTT